MFVLSIHLNGIVKLVDLRERLLFEGGFIFVIIHKSIYFQHWLTNDVIVGNGAHSTRWIDRSIGARLAW